MIPSQLVILKSNFFENEYQDKLFTLISMQQVMFFDILHTLMVSLLYGCEDIISKYNVKITPNFLNWFAVVYQNSLFTCTFLWMFSDITHTQEWWLYRREEVYVKMFFYIFHTCIVFC